MANEQSHALGPLLRRVEALRRSTAAAEAAYNVAKGFNTDLYRLGCHVDNIYAEHGDSFRITYATPRDGVDKVLSWVRKLPKAEEVKHDGANYHEFRASTDKVGLILTLEVTGQLVIMFRP